ncbi:hypothetical protein QQ056_17860 [Oscillatoria laete-virens NRMC-F 0139]|nr:hypothetical protein [Oscillatoria laete-virens]MDL5055399.1 hypothetical protein [Oscillatoria laete-virens NRMC-F 0139]
MIYVIRAKLIANGETIYAIDGTSYGKRIYYFSSKKLGGCKTWKNKAAAEKAMNKIDTEDYACVELFELTEAEYYSAIEEEENEKKEQSFSSLRKTIFGHYASGHTEIDRQIASLLLEVKVGDRLQFYPKQQSLHYKFVEVSEVKATTFVVDNKEYCRLTGKGESGDYTLPDNEIAERFVCERILKDFCSHPSDYKLTLEQQLAIVKILSD